MKMKSAILVMKNIVYEKFKLFNTKIKRKEKSKRIEATPRYIF